MEHKKYLTIQTYDKQKYKERGNGSVIHRILVNGRTREEIEQIEKDIREKQREKNLLYQARGAESIMMKDKPVINMTYENPLILDENTGNTTVLFGSSKTGKSTLMMKLYRDYYDEKKTLTTLFAMNPQIDLYGKKDKYLIKCPYLNKNTLKYIDWQRLLNISENNKYNFLNLFDDFIDVRYNSLINNLILTYRNSNVSSMLCLQYVNLLSKQARANVNNIFLFRINSDESIEVAIKVYLYSLFNRLGVDKDSHITYYKKLTDGHNYIYIHPASNRAYFSISNQWY